MRVRRTTYKLLQESGKRIENKLIEDDELKNPKTEARYTWNDQITKHSAFVFKISQNTPEDQLHGHSVFPAFTDIDKFECNMLGSTLEELREHTPVVLHRMGYFRSKGVVDMWFISNDGTVKVYRPPDFSNTIRRENFRASSGESVLDELSGGTNTSNKVLDTAIRKVLDVILRETPDAYLFLHFLGTDAKLNLADDYIGMMPGYITVQSQVRSGIIIPEVQRKNVVALLADESSLLRTPSMSYYNIFTYSRETVDTASYELYIGGENVAFSNRRAMRGIIRRVLAKNPNAILLAHRCGSPINFGLAEELRDISLSEGMVVRSHIRYKPDGSIS
ncbi:MAG: hypothetical protein Q7S22_01320 [Candidatus Micrarchaeota archaeon]|nr:hypothetical protein [Candidatus Micrarchaeota archaeon]